MWDIDYTSSRMPRQQRRKKQTRPSLSQWLYHAIANPEVRLRTRLRGNHLHILCESQTAPDKNQITSRLVRALRKKTDRASAFAMAAEEPIYRITLYGRIAGQQRPSWIELIDLSQLQSQGLQELASNSVESVLEGETPTTATIGGAAQIISSESLARSGAPEAIARYLSESFSHLGVSIQVLIQKLPVTQASPGRDNEIADKRLWVICNCDYSPDASLLAEPIAQQLRDLHLKGFREAIIRSQVSGETTPDWVLLVDLTSPEAMLEDWARWGDGEAIARLLAGVLSGRSVQVGTILKDSTLHIFCSARPGQPKLAIDKEEAAAALAPLLEQLAPQGVKAATLYGVRGPRYSLNLKEAPIWIEWLNLPAARRPELAATPATLARQKNPEALTFLLQRLLNPDLNTRLATGGIRIKLCYKANLLHVMCEGIVCPSQAEVVAQIEAFLRQLRIFGIMGVRIYGRRAGQSSALWSYGIDFFPNRNNASNPVKTVRRSLYAPAFPNSETQASPLFNSDSTLPLTSASSKINRQPSPWLASLWNAFYRTARHWLCSTQIFIPFDSTANQTPSLQPSVRSLSSSGLKGAIAWGVLGLLLTVQVDWLLGRFLAAHLHPSSPTPTAQSLSSPKFSISARAATAPASPDLSLQKSSPPPAESFNREQFTAENEKAAAKAAILAAARSSNPSLNNRLLDEKLALYQERIRQNGVPDVLIVGSSRAMRGIDPSTLQVAMSKRGYEDLEIFNFGINGATAQVVDFLLRQLLTSEQLPKLIIWADGARAFNSGRPDQTYEAIASSVGYQEVKAGNFNTNSAQTSQATSTLKTLNRQLVENYRAVDRTLNNTLAQLSAVYPQREQFKAWLKQQWVEQVPNLSGEMEETAHLAELTSVHEAIDVDGFLPLSIRFNPDTYYSLHPKVAGAYDSDYNSFALEGRQYNALRELTQFLNQQQVTMVFVNLPLTNEYLDPVRSKYEQEFRGSMQNIAAKHGFVFRDFAQRWTTEYDFFSDPSHLNRYGAYQVSLHLARDLQIPWQ